MNILTLKKVLVRLEIKETVIVLSMSVMLPFLVHLIPAVAGLPLGARLIPMFYAPFIAIVLFRPHVAIIASLLAPTLNSWLSGHPTQEIVAILTFELVVFSLIAYLIQSRWKYFWATAPLAYLVTLLFVTCLLRSVVFFINTAAKSLSGIVMLALINIFLLRLRPK